MIKIKSRKKAVLASVVVAIALVMTISMLAYPTSAAEPELQRKHVYAKARGVGIQKINNETVKIPANLTLTLTLGEKRGKFIPILNVEGLININGTVYTIEHGRGVIQTQRHVALIRCVGSDATGNQIVFKLGAAYFWWGGRLYAFRAKASLHTMDTHNLLLLRGIAKVQ